jgi:hypothetical protein
MATLFVDKIDPQSGTSLTIGSSGDTVALTSGVVQSNMMYPSFFVRKEGNQSLAGDTDTKLLPDDVVYDTDSAFDTSTGRFTVPTGKGGKYFLSYGFNIQNLDDTKGAAVNIKVNGSFLGNATNVLAGSYSFFNSATNTGSNNDDPSVATSVMLVLSAGDYVEMWGRQRDGGAENARFMHFGAYRIGA